MWRVALNIWYLFSSFQLLAPKIHLQHTALYHLKVLLWESDAFLCCDFPLTIDATSPVILNDRHVKHSISYPCMNALIQLKRYSDCWARYITISYQSPSPCRGIPLCNVRTVECSTIIVQAFIWKNNDWIWVVTSYIHPNLTRWHSYMWRRIQQRRLPMPQGPWELLSHRLVNNREVQRCIILAGTCHFESSHSIDRKSCPRESTTNRLPVVSGEIISSDWSWRVMVIGWTTL